MDFGDGDVARFEKEHCSCLGHWTGESLLLVSDIVLFVGGSRGEQDGSVFFSPP